MAITQISKILVRTGSNDDLPQLDVGEIGFATDTQRLYIGNDPDIIPDPVSGPNVTEILTTANYTEVSGWSGRSGYSGTAGTTGASGFSGMPGAFSASGFSGASGISGFSGAAFVGSSGFSGKSGFSGAVGLSGFSGAAFVGSSGFSGKSGFSGAPGVTGASGFSGAIGATGSTGASGFSGAAFVGSSGFSGTPGSAGASGFSGIAGANGTSGFSGAAGAAGASGFSGIDGANGASGFSGAAGAAGASGFSGQGLNSWAVKTSNYTAVNNDRIIANTQSGSFTIYLPVSPVTGNYIQITDGWDFAINNCFVDPNGATIEGLSDIVALDLKSVTFEFIYNGTTWEVTATTGAQGTSGYSGMSGASFVGSSGFSGISGYSGTVGISGYSGEAGTAGTSGYSGEVGTSGYSGAVGTSGYSGEVGTSGYSGEMGVSGYSGAIGASGYSGNVTNSMFLQAGTGAVSRTVQSKLRDVVSVKDFGAVGDGVTDDTVAIQNAINSLGAAAGTLYFPEGIYIVSDGDSDGTCLYINYSIQIIGDGPFYTAIQPAAGVSSSVNIITFSPVVGYGDFTTIEKIFIGNPSAGTRTGNHGIFCSTQNSGQSIAKFTLQHCYIQQGSGYAFYHLNNSGLNVNGGLYTSLIANNSLWGGVKLENSGDSIVVANNTISGTGTGVYAALTTGASLLSILDNNITSSNSAIVVLSGMRLNILRNNIEHYVTGSSNNAVIDIISSGGTYVAGVIQQNLISIFGSSDATKCIHIREARGTLIQDNVFLSGLAGRTGIYVSGTCISLRIGANTFNAAISTKVDDFGIGTMGVVKTPTLLNSWVAQTVYDVPTYYKDLSGSVIIEGVIKDGTVTPGTPLFQLPVGFRPPASTVKRFNAYTIGGSGAEFGYFLIDEAGIVTIEDGGNVQFILSGAIFRAADGPDSVSPE